MVFEHFHSPHTALLSRRVLAESIASLGLSLSFDSSGAFVWLELRNVPVAKRGQNWISVSYIMGHKLTQ